MIYLNYLYIVKEVQYNFYFDILFFNYRILKHNFVNHYF